MFIVPFIGALIYVIARPKMTAQDKEMMERAQEAQRRVEGFSAADEIQKLAALRDSGKITCQKIWSRLAPSTIAASSSSRLMVIM